MQRKIEITSKTYEEAMKLAVEKLHITEDKIFLNVLEESDDQIVCEALVDVDLALEGKRYLDGILQAFDIDYNIEVRRVNGEKEIHYVIESEENPLLIGNKGRTLDALQLLLRTIIGVYTKERLIISLDVGSYRSNRERQLEILATKTAKEVAKTKIDVKLRPMNAFERRVIHEKLSEWRDVYTESEGTGEDRALVVKAVKK